jgi:putative ABC transport system permease protein
MQPIPGRWRVGTRAVRRPSNVQMSTPIVLALQTLRANPLRTALSTLGIVMGAASLSAVLALGDGAEAFARRRLEAEGLQTVLVAAKTADQVDGVRIPRASVVRLGPDDATSLTSVVGPAVGVALASRGVVRWKGAGGADRAAAVIGTLASGPLPAPALAAGSALGPDDAEPEARSALISLSVGRTLSPDDPLKAVGQTLAIGDTPLRIAGVLAKPEGRDPPVLQVPFALMDRLPMSGATEPPAITLRPARLEDVDTLRAAAEAWATRRYGDGLAVQAYGPARLRQAAQGILIFKLLMGSFTAIALVVGGIGIMNVLLASVLERTREIGVRRAVGARRADVVRQLLAESVAIALAGSLVGLALGLGSAFAFTAIMRARTEALIYAAVTPTTIAASLGAAIVTGLVFGVYPAIRASRLVPVDAIRAE